MANLHYFACSEYPRISAFIHPGHPMLKLDMLYVTEKVCGEAVWIDWDAALPDPITITTKSLLGNKISGGAVDCTMASDYANRVGLRKMRIKGDLYGSDIRYARGIYGVKTGFVVHGVMLDEEELSVEHAWLVTQVMGYDFVPFSRVFSPTWDKVTKELACRSVLSGRLGVCLSAPQYGLVWRSEGEKESRVGGASPVAQLTNSGFHTDSVTFAPGREPKQIEFPTKPFESSNTIAYQHLLYARHCRTVINEATLTASCNILDIMPAVMHIDLLVINELEAVSASIRTEQGSSRPIIRHILEQELKLRIHEVIVKLASRWMEGD